MGGALSRGVVRVTFAGIIALAALGACGRPRAPVAAWSDRWDDLAHAGPRWHAGAEFVVATWEGLPAGARRARERWLLLKRDSVAGQFEYQREGDPGAVVALPLHPRSPDAPPRHGGEAHGRYAYAAGLETVKVPEGSFRCGRTWRTSEERDGRVMRVDEWWSPGIPVPVQSWTRWEGVVDTLYAPPRRAADVRVGTEWAVLERIRQP